MTPSDLCDVCDNYDTNVHSEIVWIFVLNCSELSGPKQEYAGDGLRTLALAYKDLDEGYMEEWRQRHHEASTAMEGREERLDELYEEIEKDLLVSRPAEYFDTLCCFF